MLATKKRGARRAWFFCTLALATFCLFSGCTPAGPKALLRGKAHLEADRIPEALAQFKKSVELLPLNAQARNYLGLANHLAGNAAEAVEAYHRAFELDNQLWVTQFNLGNHFLEQDLPSKAADHLKVYCMSVKDDPEGWLKLAEAQYRARTYLEAMHSLNESLRLNPQQPVAVHLLGLIQLETRRYEEAYQSFRTVVRLDPKFAPAVLNMAVMMQAYFKDYQKAHDQYDYYLNLNNGREMPYANQVQRLMRQLKVALQPPPTLPDVQTNALAQAQTTRTNATQASTSAQPTNAIAVAATITNRTDTIAIQQPDVSPTIPANRKPDPQEATPAETPSVSSVSQPVSVVDDGTEIDLPIPAIVEDPKDSKPDAAVVNPAELNSPKPDPVRSVTPLPDQKSFSPYSYRILVRPDSGDREAAEELFVQAFEAQSKREWGKAIGLYQQAVEKDPSFFPIQFNLGYCASVAGDMDLALAAYEKALAINPESLDARFFLAKTLKSANHPRDAARELLLILEDHPDDARSHFLVANIYSNELRLYQSAKEHYERVLQLEPSHPQAAQIRRWITSLR